MNVNGVYNVRKIIAVDFDGTLCENNWPGIGKPNHKVISYCIEQRRAGNKVILWTCRTAAALEEAEDWCALHGLFFDAVNENLRETIEQFGGDEGRKIFAHEYIDDRMNVTFDLPYIFEGEINKMDIDNNYTTHIPNFDNPLAYVKARIKILKRDFKIKLSKEEKDRLYTLTNRYDIDTAIHTIIMNKL